MPGIRCLLASVLTLGSSLAAAEKQTLLQKHEVGLATSSDAQDPSDLYFQGWLLSRDADKLKAGKQDAESLEKYQKALGIFKQVASEHPNWKPEMVKGRIERTEEAMASLKPAEE